MGRAHGMVKQLKPFCGIKKSKEMYGIAKTGDTLNERNIRHKIVPFLYKNNTYLIQINRVLLF